MMRVQTSTKPSCVLASSTTSLPRTVRCTAAAAAAAPSCMPCKAGGNASSAPTTKRSGLRYNSRITQVTRLAPWGPPAAARCTCQARRLAAHASSTDAAAAEARYPVLLAILLKLSAPDATEQFDAFVRAQPSATAVPFISWVADMEGRATAREERAALGALCERLVLTREAAEGRGQAELYAKTLQLLGDGDGEQESLVRADPKAYALGLAEALTGGPVVREGYSPVYDALLAAAPPAALTPEGVALAHKEAAELAEDMRARRRRSFAAVVGRMKIQTPEQEAALLAPSAASRILDLLLSLDSAVERESLLPDCFTPPPGADGSSSSSSGGQGVVEGDETDEIWCTPLQLLNEINARLRDVVDAPSGAAAQQRPAQQPLLGGGHGLSGEAYGEALLALRAAVETRWLQTLPAGAADGQQ